MCCRLLTYCRRAVHLLQLLGHPLSESDRLSDIGFLAEVLEVQEDLQTCDIAALRVHSKRNFAKLQREQELASAAFSEGRISDAKAVVMRLQ
jgi:hypothetical protein